MQMSQKGQRTRAMRPYSQSSPKTVAYITMYKNRPQQLQGIQGRTHIKEAGSSYSKSGNGKRKDGNNWGVSEDFQEKELSHFFSIKKKQLL